MSVNFNRVILLGYLGADPELRYTRTGIAVANFSVATTKSWKNAGGDWQEKTQWHKVVAWRGTAELVNEQLTRGALVYLEGSLEYGEWTDRNDVKHVKAEIVIHTFHALSRRRQTVEEVGDYPDPPEDRYDLSEDVR